MKTILQITTNILILLTITVILPSVFINSHQGLSQNVGTKTITLTKQKPITFSFKSDYPNLHRIDIDFKNPNLKNTSTIDFTVSNSISERSMSFTGANIGDPSTVPLKFQGFSDPPNTPYTVTITTDNDINDSLSVITNDQGIPKFKSKYQQDNMIEKINYNFNKQLEQFTKRSKIHNFIYIAIILLLNTLILKK